MDRQAVENTLRRLLGRPALAEFHEDIAEALRALEGGAEPTQAWLPGLTPAVEAFLFLEMAGWLDGPKPPAVVEPLPDDMGPHPPTLAEAVAAGSLPPPQEIVAETKRFLSVGESWDVHLRDLAVDEGERRRPDGEPRAATGPATFVFLHDPQVSRQEGRKDTNERVVAVSQLNRCLNALASGTWPANLGLSCEGQAIGEIRGAFIGGDLCQTGGDYDFVDQSQGCPAYYRGGWELQAIRRLFASNEVSGGVVPLTCTVYFGLGNHDRGSDFVPGPGWREGFWGWSRPSDYWRWQMWNFIAQMHSSSKATCGVVRQKVRVPARNPVTAIDASGGSFDWTKFSFNYKVDLGPVDVYQVHVFGGDTYGGDDDPKRRAAGLGWLKEQLDAGGPRRPVIVVQHYAFDVEHYPPKWQEKMWTPEQRDAFLTLLEPYNVVALLVGHLHTPPESAYSFRTDIASPNGRGRVPQFRPGAAFWVDPRTSSPEPRFALCRVATTRLDIASACATADGTPRWEYGASLPIETTDERLTFLGSTKPLDPDWTVIASGKFGGSGVTDLLFYRRSNGLFTFFTVDEDRGMTPIPAKPKGLWDGGWDVVTAGNFGGGTDRSDLLFYRRSDGYFAFYELDESLNMTRLVDGDSWNQGDQGWTTIVAGDFGGGTGNSDLLFYRGGDGACAYYKVTLDDKLNPVHLLDGSGTWDGSWTHITAGDFGASREAADLLFYRAGDGLSIVYGLARDRSMTPFASSTWPRGWTAVTPGRFGGVSGRSDLLCYAGGEGTFYSI